MSQATANLKPSPAQAELTAPMAVGFGDLLGRAWDILKARGPMRGSDLGWELWGETTEVPRRGTGSHQHNKFCRPAGKVLKRLQRLGCAREIPAETCMTWAAMGNRPNDTLCREAGQKDV